MLEREAMAVLVSTQGLDYGRREMALRAAGSAEAVLADPLAYAAQLSAEGAAAVQQMIRSGGARRTLEELERQQVRLAVRGEAGYPQRLLQIAHPPHLLFCWGEANLDDAFPFAVVGTRKASPYGLAMTREIAAGLAAAGVCIVSGLALGVDAAAHRGALDAGGRTVAVLGGALDKLYPAANKPLAREILANGGSVVSEYPMGMPPSRYSFLHRNRIIAGMSLGVLVTEGAKRSGALRTAEDALACGREVFALPGDVRSETSQLPHALIRDGAHLTTSAQDILNMLCIEPPAKAAPKEAPRSEPPAGQQPAPDSGARRTPPGGLGETETRVWQALCGGECDFDELCQRTDTPAEELGSVLMMMELDGVIEALAGLRYRLA